MQNSDLHPRDRWFEDWSAGDSFIGETTYVMEQQRMIDFATEFDPQDFHTDPEAAKHTSFGGLVASGWHTGAAMMSCLTEFLGPASMGAAGVDELRWHRPAVAGDELRLTWTVLDTRASESKPDRGVVRVLQEFHDSDGERVMSFISIMMCKTRAGREAEVQAG